MFSKPKTTTSFLVIVVLAALFRGSASNADQDKAECADKLVGITTCLPYVAGETKSPSLDCCTGLKPVIDKSRKCLCLVIKDRDDPSLGLKINLTLALGLPDACHTPMNITECVDLLHLAPNSTEAKAFKGSMAAGNVTTPANTPCEAPSPTGSSTGTTTPSTSGPTPSTEQKSQGGIKLRTSWGLEITCAASILFFTSLYKAFE